MAENHETSTTNLDMLNTVVSANTKDIYYLLESDKIERDVIVNIVNKMAKFDKRTKRTHRLIVGLVTYFTVDFLCKLYLEYKKTHKTNKETADIQSE